MNTGETEKIYIPNKCTKNIWGYEKSQCLLKNHHTLFMNYEKRAFLTKHKVFYRMKKSENGRILEIIEFINLHHRFWAQY